MANALPQHARASQRAADKAKPTNLEQRANTNPHTTLEMHGQGATVAGRAAPLLQTLFSPTTTSPPSATYTTTLVLFSALAALAAA